MPGAVIAAEGRNRQDRVLIRVTSAAYHASLDRLLRSQEANFRLTEVSHRKVAGCPAVIAKFNAKRGGRYNPRTCYVLADDTLYIIESSDSAGANAAFQLAIKSLKLSP